MQAHPTGFQSSEEKDIVREHFDLPLLRQLHELKERPLAYFGLPGEEARDVLAWQDVIGSVVAVEREINYLGRLENLLDKELPGLDYTTHWGSVDNVIISNQGRPRHIGKQVYRPFVGNHFENEIRRHVWRFDVVYLDYFGQLLPGEDSGGAGAALRRAAALRNLFTIDRVDAWDQWVLLITVQAQFDEATRTLVRDFLTNTRMGAAANVQASLDFLLSNDQIPQEEAAPRLVHGAAAVVISNAAQNARLRVHPRGTVLYKGTNNRYMVHLAFGFNPEQNPLGGVSDLHRLLPAPILRPNATSGDPSFELIPGPCPSMTRESVRQCLDFLPTHSVDTLVSSLP